MVSVETVRITHGNGIVGKNLIRYVIKKKKIEFGI